VSVFSIISHSGTVFRVAASSEGSDIRIINEPLEGSSVFLVETGEGAELHLKHRWNGYIEDMYHLIYSK